MELLVRVALDRVSKELHGVNPVLDVKQLAAHSSSSGSTLPTVLEVLPEGDSELRAALDADRPEILAGSPERLMGIEVTVTNSCPSNHVTSRTATSMVTDLVYASVAPETTFAHVVANSLHNTKKTLRAWCDQCKAYVALLQVKSAKQLPHVLCFAAAVGSSESYSEAQIMSVLYGKPGFVSSGFSINPGENDSLRVEEALLSPGGHSGPGLHYELVGVLSHVAHTAVPAASTTSTASATHTLDPVLSYHYVSSVRLSEEGCTSITGAEKHPAWYLFNDFRVAKMEPALASDFSAPWRTPVIFFYQQVGSDATSASTAAKAYQARKHCTQLSMESDRLAAGFRFADPLLPHPMVADVMRVPKAVFCIPPSIPHQPKLGPVPSGEGVLPFRDLFPDGGVVAIDAEFVSTSAESLVHQRDGGGRQVVRSAILAPGRVSVVKPDVSVLFDHYLAVSEPILDHLTRFSGLVIGDLDVNFSTHRLHTFKESYTKLRALIDCNTKFIGHGLVNDCRILNLFIREEQKIDTVDIFKIEGMRNLSLKFLSSHVLQSQIQGKEHDSCEDAISALLLYKHYVALVENEGRETFEKLVRELYSTGRSTGWRANVTAGASSEGPGANKPKRLALQYYTPHAQAPASTHASPSTTKVSKSRR
jgi:hypothetical protein